MRSARRNPPLALALNGMAVRSQQWMLTAAGIGAAGPKGMVRAQGLALLFANVLRTWVDDDDDRLAAPWRRSTASCRSGQRWAGLLDDLCRIPQAACRFGAACARAASRGGRRGRRARPRRKRSIAVEAYTGTRTRRAQAAERAVAERDVAAVRARDVAGDGEAEAGAALVLVARVVEPQERLEHLLAHARAECRARRRRP